MYTRGEPTVPPYPSLSGELRFPLKPPPLIINH